MQYLSRRLFFLVLMLLLTFGVAAAFNIERGRYDGRGEIAFSSSHLPLAVDGCASPSPTPSPEPTPALQPRNDQIVSVMNPSLLIGAPGDTLTLTGSLTNTSAETYAYGYGFVGDPTTAQCTGNASRCPIFDFGPSRLINDPLPPHTSTGVVPINDIKLNADYRGPLPLIIKFTFYTFKPGMFSGITNFSVRIEPRTDPSRPPLLFTDPCTQRAVALDSVKLNTEPFELENSLNFSSDQRTRLMLFAWNMNLQPGEGPAAVTVQAIDAQQTIHVLPIEFVSDVDGEPGLTQIVVRLPDDLPSGTDLRLRVLVHGFTSNEAPMAIKSG